ncbi:MAG: 2-oxo-4-hydroxy-4-carboxy-5-ureidoimidazoline decarboxylase [Bacteroidetes bacterium]|nr:MAG: 2-oxo-4-hydroxy-4-carboxy-5-ureidoimidazoline decarboxylase [Bacteroidota bacterium]REK04731.1 MAG: 2-oxo-4-hydroxy-4-carboxy-5-ureidoimidazoline decarboxylase [Bacteroidota bacterium]REK36205.1 MAG: 2-oxo-4-hydroxy-4-carboxy-5-ureidoimidazoline decarboxylase [Bacteroidota bacterium]REK51424.1 MAG: 2-oxo-4-hydroxy-4-carboxy-5-ureidoimidazoline decarboxylase [Bacteroidota bacterium]
MDISEFNSKNEEQIREELSRCCGSRNWVNCMLSSRPFNGLDQMLEIADKCWEQTNEEDWLESFHHHPKIGDIESLAKKFASTSNMAGDEQSGVKNADMKILQALAEGNRDYEEKFGFIFIVYASGKRAEEMLGILNERMNNDRYSEIRIAAAEQHKITRLRITKMFA